MVRQSRFSMCSSVFVYWPKSSLTPSCHANMAPSRTTSGISRKGSISSSAATHRRARPILSVWLRALRQSARAGGTSLAVRNCRRPAGMSTSVRIRRSMMAPGTRTAPLKGGPRKNLLPVIRTIAFLRRYSSSHSSLKRPWVWVSV